VVESGRLAALVSPLPSAELKLRRRDLRAHLSVLERAFERSTIVPCRFGTVLEDETAVALELLDARAAELDAALARLDGRAQLNVRVEYDEDEVLREIVLAEPEIAELRRRTQELGDAGHFARIRLGELVTQALEQRRDADSARILPALEQAAEDVLVERAGELVVLKASFLVTDRTAFDRLLDRLAREEAPRLRFESIGPLPPTAFVDAGGA
jgi:hypothetical protein